MGAGTEPAEAQCDSLEGKVYLDHNATTPLAPEVAQAVWDAMCQAWGNPSSSHPTGRKAKELIGSARESLARMLGGRPEDIVFTSGGTEANNMVIHTACRHFHESQCGRGDRQGTPHIVTSSVEHDSIRLPLEQLGREGLAGRRVLAHCKVLLASVGAACHSEKGDRPSPVLLSCGIPLEVARNALRLSVGRGTARADVDRAVQDLVQAVEQLERDPAP